MGQHIQYTEHSAWHLEDSKHIDITIKSLLTQPTTFKCLITLPSSPTVEFCLRILSSDSNFDSSLGDEKVKDFSYELKNSFHLNFN